MKKIIIGIIIASLVVISVCVPCWVDDLALSGYEEKIEKSIAEVPEIKVLQVVSGCGNSSGTGDHTELYVAVLVETNLYEDDIKNKITGITDVHDVRANGYKTLVMDMIDLNFDEKSYNGRGNCYILEFSERAPCSSFDMRGV